jgi:endonuclease III
MLTLPELLNHLAAVYGEPSMPPERSLFELVVFENVVYLADDAARARAFELLRANVGVDPDSLLAASDATLEAATGHGILAAHQSNKLRQIARLTRDEFGGDLERLRGLHFARARRALMRFPSIGEPGAEKILLFARAQPLLGLESNGVRVLTRVGLVQEAKSYSATYRSVQQLVLQFADRGYDWLIRAHLLLRQHGQELCRRSRPRCDSCPVSNECAFYHGSLCPS